MTFVATPWPNTIANRLGGDQRARAWTSRSRIARFVAAADQLVNSERPFERVVAEYVRAKPDSPIVHEAGIYFLQALAILYGAENERVPMDGMVAFLLLASKAQILQDALSLEAQDRARIARELIESLEEAHAERGDQAAHRRDRGGNCRSGSWVGVRDRLRAAVKR